MAVISVRLNTEEEKMISFLSEHFEEEKSTLIKHSLKELYEDILDRKIIEEFEVNEVGKKARFISTTEILSSL
jgi:hypothetical protein